MTIAYITFEYPPYTSGGGIGTYMFQISNAMASRGHKVCVICSGVNNEIQEIGCLKVFFILIKDKSEFSAKAAELFNQINKSEEFDLVECAEYGADAINIKKEFPKLPLVIKLHAPSYLITQFNNYYFNYQITPDFKTNSSKQFLKNIFWYFRRTIL